MGMMRRSIPSSRTFVASGIPRPATVHRVRRGVSIGTVLVAAACTGPSGPASHDDLQGGTIPPPPRAPLEVSEAEPGTLDYDRDVWQTLLHHHASIRRTVTRLPNGLAAVTESDDPAIARLIQDHALAMKQRMTTGARVRIWDPVFVELFDRHDKVRLDVTLTPRGVSIHETTDDPATLRLMRSHAAGVSDMVREGSAASQRPTPFVEE